MSTLWNRRPSSAETPVGGWPFYNSTTIMPHNATVASNEIVIVLSHAYATESLYLPDLELNEAFEDRRRRRLAVLAERKAEVKHRREKPSHALPPLSLKPWQASVRAFRGRSGAGA